MGRQALKFFGELYEVGRAVAALAFEERGRVRQKRSRKVADALPHGSPRSSRSTRRRFLSSSLFLPKPSTTA
jgi:hypothetical protein